MMRALSFVCGCLVLVPAAGYAQNRNAAPPAVSQSATTDDYAQLNRQQEVQGSLVARDSEAGPDKISKRRLVLRYDYEVMDRNPNYRPTVPAKPRDFTKEFQALQNKINAANQIQNVQKRTAALQDLANKQLNLMMQVLKEQDAYLQRVADARDRDIKAGNVPFIKVAKAKEFELEIENDLVIRRLKPVVEYDDKGFRKGEPDGNGFVGYTKEELDKLHLVDNADGKKPGLPAKYDDLKPKQTITLTLKPGKQETAKKSKADKTDTDDEPFIPLRPSVRMIVIVEDVAGVSNDGDLPPVKKKKKKKQE